MKRLIIITAAALALLSACVQTERTAGISSEAADFTLKDLDGRRVSLGDFKGKIVLIEFWASWCQPCRSSIPGVEKIYQNYADKGVVVLGISLDGGDWDTVRKFRDEYKMTYPVLEGTDRVAEQYSVRTIPLLILLDREGKVRKRSLGAGNEEDLEKEIKSMLAAG